MDTNTTALACDLIYGAQAIGQFLGIETNRTGYLIRTGQIPCGKIGQHLVASKKTLREHFERVASGTAAA